MPHRGKKLLQTQLGFIISLVCMCSEKKAGRLGYCVCSRSILTSSPKSTVSHHWPRRHREQSAQLPLRAPPPLQRPSPLTAQIQFQYGWLLCWLSLASWLAVWWPGSSSPAEPRETRGWWRLLWRWGALCFKVPPQPSLLSFVVDYWWERINTLKNKRTVIFIVFVETMLFWAIMRTLFRINNPNCITFYSKSL